METVKRPRVYDDERLTWKATGIMFYLVERGTMEGLTVAEIVKSGTDGVGSVSAGLKELIKLGYVKRELIKEKDGRYNGYKYTLTETPK